eukprot:gene8490-960_t
MPVAFQTFTIEKSFQYKECGGLPRQQLSPVARNPSPLAVQCVSLQTIARQQKNMVRDEPISTPRKKGSSSSTTTNKEALLNNDRHT